MKNMFLTTVRQKLCSLLGCCSDGMTPAEVEAAKAQLVAIIARLNAILPDVPAGSKSKSVFLVPESFAMATPPKAVPQTMQDLLTAVNGATTALGTRVSALQAKVGVGMTQADVDSVNAGLNQIVANLNAIAADPVNPIPAPTP